MNRFDPPRQLAEPESRAAEKPPQGSTHPTIVDRLAKDVVATAAALDATDAKAWTQDEPFKALTTLLESVVGLHVEAETHRP